MSYSDKFPKLFALLISCINYEKNYYGMNKIFIEINLSYSFTSIIYFTELLSDESFE